MRSITTALLFAGLSLLALGGCATPAQNIEAASTRIKMTSPVGRTIEITLPKELDADAIMVEVDPVTGKFTLTADKLRSSSQGVVQTAVQAQAEATGKVADALQAVVPLLTR